MISSCHREQEQSFSTDPNGSNKRDQATFAPPSFIHEANLLSYPSNIISVSNGCGWNLFGEKKKIPTARLK